MKSDPGGTAGEHGCCSSLIDLEGEVYAVFLRTSAWLSPKLMHPQNLDNQIHTGIFVRGVRNIVTMSWNQQHFDATTMQKSDHNKTRWAGERFNRIWYKNTAVLGGLCNQAVSEALSFPVAQRNALVCEWRLWGSFSSLWGTECFSNVSP